MLALWSLMHGTAMLIIRGGFEGVLRTQTIHACLDAFDGILDSVARSNGRAASTPKWPSNLILGEGKQSRIGNGNGGGRKARSKARKLKRAKASKTGELERLLRPPGRQLHLQRAGVALAAVPFSR